MASRGAQFDRKQVSGGREDPVAHPRQFQASKNLLPTGAGRRSEG